MGKAALITVMAFSVMGAVYAINGNMTRLTSEGHVADYQHEVLARSAAIAGQKRAEQALAEDFDSPPGSLTGEYERVPYRVSLRKAGNTVTVESVGTATNAVGKEIPFHIRAIYEEKEDLTGNVIASEAPEFMQYAILAEDELALHGNVGVEIEAKGDERNELNANVHSNTKLRVWGNVNIEGFGTSAGPVEAGSGFFNPYNPNGASPTQAYVTPVDIPEFDAEGFVREMVGEQCLANPASCSNRLRIDNNGVRLGGSGNGTAFLSNDGTREAPYVWYVRGGMLDITGNVQIPGYVVFIAEDGFKIAGNVTLGETGYTGGDESSVAIYTGKSGEIDLRGNSRFYGQVYAEEALTVYGNVNVHGSLATQGTVSIGGNPRIYYRAPSPALTKPWQETPTYVELVAYNEW